jgi:hypothetical protein
VQLTPTGLSKDKLVLKISKLMHDIYYEYRNHEDHFNSLVAIGGKEINANLYYFLPDGRPTPIDTCKAIGAENLGDIFLNNIWITSMNMEQVAEIGHLIINCIEKFELEDSVGLGKNEPMIWFIPDNSDEDYLLVESSELMSKFIKSTSDRLPLVENLIKELFPYGKERK